MINTAVPTMQLRFLDHRVAPKQVIRTLQQLWNLPDGTTEWRNIPIIEVKMPTPG
jgi:hypothetical protein